MVPGVDTARTDSKVTASLSPPEGGMLRCAGNLLGSGDHRTKARLDQNVAEEAARRLGTLAILTAITVVGTALLQHGLQPELAAAHGTAMFRLSALFLVLASVALAALARSKLVLPQALLD